MSDITIILFAGLLLGAGLQRLARAHDALSAELRRVGRGRR